MQTYQVDVTITGNTEPVKVGERNYMGAPSFETNPAVTVIPAGGGTASYQVTNSASHPGKNLTVIDADQA